MIYNPPILPPTSTAAIRTRSVRVNPVHEWTNVGVNTSVASASTSIPPAHNTSQHSGAGDGDGSTRVAGARVLAGRGGAEHVGRDGRGAVLRAAGGAGHDRDGHVAERGRERASALRGRAPSRDGRANPSCWVSALGRESRVPNVASSGDGSRESPERKVVVGGACAVAWAKRTRRVSSLVSRSSSGRRQEIRGVSREGEKLGYSATLLTGRGSWRLPRWFHRMRIAILS